MNKVFLSGAICQKPEIKFTEDFVNVKFFLTDTQGEKYECFAIDRPAFCIAGLTGQKHIEQASVYGKLCNYHYRDATNTIHKSKFILVYAFEEGDLILEETERARVEQIDKKMAAFLKKGYAPISKLVDAYIQEV